MTKRAGLEKIIRESKYDEEWWNEWVRKGDWRPEGYKIIEVGDGPSLNKLTPQRFMIVYRPHANMFNHSYGKVSRFFEGLLEGKLFGTKCPNCGLTYCPPRAHCFNSKCRLRETEWIELAKRGTVYSYTIMAIAWPAMAHMQPLVGVMVRIEGTNTCLPMIMKDVDPEKVNIGLKVEIHISDKPKGDLQDVYGTPAEEPVGPERTERELKRFRADMELTREWVRKKFSLK